MGAAPGAYLAMIDVGSHELSMRIARLKRKEAPRLIEQVTQTIAAGADTYRDGRLSSNAVKAMIETLQRFLLKAKSYRQARVLATATSAFREAKNQAFVCDQILRETGLEIRVLSNNEENYFHLLSLAQRLEDFKRLAEGSLLILELGAGSAQLTQYEQGHFVYSQNMRLGSLRIRELLSDLEAHSPDFNQLMMEYINGEFTFYRHIQRGTSAAEHLVINGEHLRYLRQMMGLENSGTIRVSQQLFLRCLKELKQATERDLSLRFHISQMQAALLLPTALVIRELFEFTALEEAIFVDASLADGHLLAVAEAEMGFRPVHNVAGDVVHAARQISRRFRTDHAHAEAVERFALEIFDQSKALHGLQEDDRRQLQLAAIMHNVGKVISMQEDELRSFEIVTAASLPGYTDANLQFLAGLVYYHNGDLEAQPALIEQFSAKEQLRMAKLAAILSLANALDAGHQQKIRRVRLLRKKDALHMELFSARDITLELWDVLRHQGLFEEVYGVRIESKRRAVNA